MQKAIKTKESHARLGFNKQQEFVDINETCTFQFSFVEKKRNENRIKFFKYLSECNVQL